MHGQADARARHSAALFETVAAMYISTMGLVCASGRALHTWVVLLLEGSEKFTSLLSCTEQHFTEFELPKEELKEGNR
jgi:hypothetical protein